MYNLDVQNLTDELVDWIRNWFDKNGKGCNAVIGLSGGKDSTILCALLVKALGKERVITVGMPGQGQDLHGADEIAKYFGVKFIVVPIDTLELFYQCNIELTKQAKMNVAPRLRMVTLYAISQSNNGRVIGTTNLDENLLGYFTKFGDGLASDCEPMEKLTVNELRAIGDYLGIPKKWVYKTPSADLPNVSTDEEEFGFTYEEFGNYIRGIKQPTKEKQKKMEDRIEANVFKHKDIESYDPWVLLFRSKKSSTILDKGDK